MTGLETTLVIAKKTRSGFLKLRDTDSKTEWEKGYNDAISHAVNIMDIDILLIENQILIERLKSI